MNDSEIASGMYVIQNGSECAITKVNGGGFTTTLSSVVQNGSSYVVVLTVEHGCQRRLHTPGNIPQTLGRR